MKPLVSILIPAYNAEQWLADTLISALAQTWENKEIIVIDDGSKDATLSIARGFEDYGVKVFTQQNQGAAATRNNCYARSRGAYIQWLDADDLIGSEKIARQMRALGDTPDSKVLLSGEWAHFMYRPGRAKFVPSSLWADLSKAEWLIRKMSQNVFMQTASWLVSRTLTDAAGPWDTRLLGDDDGEYFCRVLMASDQVRFVPGAKVYYRRPRTSSLSYIGTSDRKREAQWLSMKMHINYLRSLDDSARAREACVTFLRNWVAIFYPDRMDLFGAAERLAAELGGRLEPPRYSWKYAWINTLFGSKMARRAQQSLPQVRLSMARFYDRALLFLEGGERLAGLGI